MKMTSQLILSTLKCNSMTPKALKLHLQSIKLQKSFYCFDHSSHLCNKQDLHISRPSSTKMERVDIICTQNAPAKVSVASVTSRQ
jgi:hypothetical protein